MNGEQRGVCVTVPLQKGVRFPVQYNTTATHVQVHITPRSYMFIRVLNYNLNFLYMYPGTVLR
jgi:hypothetical protein